MDSDARMSSAATCTTSRCPRRSRRSRSTTVIVALAIALALGGGLLISGIGLALMALVFRGGGELDGQGVDAFLALGLGAALLVTLVL